MRINKLLCFLILFFICSPNVNAKTKQQVCPLTEEKDYLQLTIQRSEQAKKAIELREKAKLANQGIYFANLCLEKTPNSTPCVYYRGVNRGIELETRTFKVKMNLRRMVNDFLHVIHTNDQYDFGGAYLAIGYVYLKSPSLPVLGKFKRDLNKAQEFAEKALEVSVNHPYNLKLAGEVAYKKKNYKEATVYFKSALRFLSSYKANLDDYDNDKRVLKKLLKKAKKKARRAT